MRPLFLLIVLLVSTGCSSGKLLVQNCELVGELKDVPIFECNKY